MMMYLLILVLTACHCVNHIHAQAAVNEEWKLDEFLNMFSNGSTKHRPINAALSDLTQKADKLYHKLENSLKQLTSGAVHLANLDPRVVNNECSCYCRCPQDTINSKVINDVKVKVMDLKERFKNVGRSIKEKIHKLTTR